MADLSFDSLIEEYLVYCHIRQLRQKTMNSYEQTLRLFQRWCYKELGITTVDAGSESVIRHYITSIQERGKYSFYSSSEQMQLYNPERRRDYRKPVSATTINNYVRNLKAFFSWLAADRYIQRNPMKRVKFLKAERKAREYLTDAEFKKLVNSMDKSYFSEHRDYTMIMLMIDTGMRLGECSMLRVADIDMSRRQIYIHADIAKGVRDRSVFFSLKTERVLRNWLQFKDRYVESEYLFPTKKNKMPVNLSSFESNFKGYIRRAKIEKDVTPHCLRNNFAKRCLMNGMDIYTLSRLLGHSSVTVTEEAYLDLTDNDIGQRYQHFSPVTKM